MSLERFWLHVIECASNDLHSLLNRPPAVAGKALLITQTRAADSTVRDDKQLLCCQVHAFSYIYLGRPTDYTLNQKKQKCFLPYFPQNLADFDKLWYVLSWETLPYINANVSISLE